MSVLAKGRVGILSALQSALRNVFLIDVRSLACVRIVLGALLAMTFVNFAIYAPLLMSDSGVFPREMSLNATRSQEFSLFMGNGSVLFQYCLLTLGTIAALLFIVSIWPRTALFVCWVIFYSVTFRSTEYNFGLCPAMLGVLFWGLFAPWDSAPRSPFIAEQSLESGKTRILHWSLCGMFLSCAAVSCGAGLAKFKNYSAWFSDYSALRLDLSYYANVNPVTQLLAGIPYFVQIASPLVVLVELGAPLAMLVPVFRRAIVSAALVMTTMVYVGIAVSIHVGIFPLIPLIGFYLMIGSRFWEWCAARWVVRATGRIIGKVQILCAAAWSTLRRGGEVLLRCIGTVLIVCFAILALQHQTGGVVPAGIERAAERISAPIFSFFQVRTQWDWIYGGGIRNRFLIARARTSAGVLLVNMTSVHYRGVLYNYFMNYSNSILRGKDDPQRLLQYARFVCSRGFHSTGITRAEAVVQSLQLFDVPDSENALGKLSAVDQDALQDAIGGSAPFFSFDCGQVSSAVTRAKIEDFNEVRPGSAVDLPLLGWTQEYGALRLDRAVDGAPISIRGRIFQRGFGTHANSKIRLVTKGMKRFRAFVGVDDEKGKSPYSSVIVRIEGDGRELYRSPMLSTSHAALAVDIDIAGVSQLTLISDDAGQGLNENKNCDDHVSWGDPVVE